MKIPLSQFTIPNGYRIEYGDAVEVQVPEFDIKDAEGNILQVGDKVAAAVMSYRSAHLRIVKIKSFLEFPAVIYHSNDWYDKSKRIPINVVAYEIKFVDAKFTRDGKHVAKVA